MNIEIMRMKIIVQKWLWSNEDICVIMKMNPWVIIEGFVLSIYNPLKEQWQQDWRSLICPIYNYSMTMMNMWGSIALSLYCWILHLLLYVVSFVLSFIWWRASSSRWRLLYGSQRPRVWRLFVCRLWVSNRGMMTLWLQYCHGPVLEGYEIV